MQTTVFTLILLTVGLLTLAIQFLAIVNLFNREKEDKWGRKRWLWVTLTLLTNLIGSILYLVASRSRLDRNHQSRG